MDHSPLTLVRGKRSQRKGDDGARVCVDCSSHSGLWGLVSAPSTWSACVPRRGRNRRAARSFDMIKRTHADFDLKIDSSW